MRARACNGGLTAAERKVMHNEIKRQLAELNRLIEYYNMSEDDEAWLCSRKLKEAGIDFEKWEAEKWDI